MKGLDNGASGVRRLRRTAPPAYGASGVRRLRRTAPPAYGASGVRRLRRTAPPAYGASGVWVMVVASLLPSPIDHRAKPPLTIARSAHSAQPPFGAAAIRRSRHSAQPPFGA